MSMETQQLNTLEDLVSSYEGAMKNLSLIRANSIAEQAKHLGYYDEFSVATEEARENAWGFLERERAEDEADLIRNTENEG